MKPNKTTERRKDDRVAVFERLTARDVDIEFLNWLEGPEDRLPNIRALREVSGVQLTAALRAATWLTQLSSNSGVVPKSAVESWDERYLVLERFLVAALKLSGNYCLTFDEDLAHLEETLKTLLPASSWAKYAQDIRRLRKLGQPVLIPKGRRLPTGGSPESEETQRMRAAIAYLVPFTKSQFLDLAELWNLKRGRVVYDGETIRQRLRKGPASSRSFTEEHLRFWQGLFLFEEHALFAAFPGSFPPSGEFRDLYTRRTGETTPWD